MEVTVDSSVLVSALVEGDEHFSPAGRVLARHFDGEYMNATSLTVPIGRLLNCPKSGEAEAKIARSQLKRWEDLGLMRFEELSRKKAEESLRLRARLKLRGMDAIVVQVAR